MPRPRPDDFQVEALKDPVTFCKHFLKRPDGSPALPHEAQEHIIRNISPVTVVDTGRQFGKSEGMAMLGVHKAVTHSNWNIMIIGPSLEQARIIFDKIAYFFSQPPLSYLVEGKIKQYPFPDIRLKNGTRIMGRGANSPNYIRGNSVHLALVDEAAFIRDDTIKFVIQPMFTVTGKDPDAALVLISTPFGQGIFKEWYDLGKPENPKHNPRYTTHHYSSLDNPYADLEQLYAIRDQYGEDSLIWKTEYLGLFADSDLAVFKTDDIRWAWEHGVKALGGPVKQGAKYVQGVDLANVRDFFVSEVLELDRANNLEHLVAMERARQKGYAYYKQAVRSIWKRYHNAPTLIDATSLGESVVEDLADIGASGFKFSSVSKFDLVSELSRAFSEHVITIPFDQTIIGELANFEYKFTASKNLKMEAAHGHHDDIVMALALAHHQALQPTNIGFFMPVKTTVGYPEQGKRPLNYDPVKALFEEV